MQTATSVMSSFSQSGNAFTEILLVTEHLFAHIKTP